MDISIDVDNYLLNVRVAVIIKITENDISLEGNIYNYKFLLSKIVGGHYYTVGGRIKVGETSAMAACRELDEELGLKVDEKNLKFVTTMEHMFVFKESTKLAHELCFMYELVNIDEVIKSQILLMLSISEEFVLLSPSELQDVYILPEINKDILLAGDAAPSHCVVDYR